MGAFDTATTKPIEAHGIYQSTCPCRTAVNLYAGDTAPHCFGCGKPVVWRMVQAVQPTAPVPRRSDSQTRLRAPRPGPVDVAPPPAATTPTRRRLDSVAGD